MDVTIRALPKGPLMVRGACEIRGSDGEPLYSKNGVVLLCRCGNSSSKPFCDGTHKRIGFDDSAVAAPAEEESADEPGARSDQRH